MKIERRINANADVKLEKRADGQPQVISGTAAVFYDGTPGTEYVLWESTSERCVERLLPGAFDKALARPDDVRGLFNHDPNMVLGRTASGTMRLTATPKALAYEITPGNTSVAADVKEMLGRKDVNGSSFSFNVEEERWTETKDENGKWNVLREILSVSLLDCGPVTFPAYESTTAGVRAEGDPAEARQALAAFRAKGKTPPAPTGADVIAAANAATKACNDLYKLLGAAPDTTDADALTALAATDKALDLCDDLIDVLLGEDDEGDEAAPAAGADEASRSKDYRARMLQLAELE